jgi:hypothetical protein
VALCVQLSGEFSPETEGEAQAMTNANIPLPPGAIATSDWGRTFRIEVTERIVIVGEQDNTGRVIEAHIAVRDSGGGETDLDGIELADLQAAYAKLEALSDPQEIVGS